MNPDDFKKIRNRLGLTQAELAMLLGVSGKSHVSHIETGVRQPGILVMALMAYLDSLSERRAKSFVEEFRSHVADAVTSAEGRRNE